MDLFGTYSYLKYIFDRCTSLFIYIPFLLRSPTPDELSPGLVHKLKSEANFTEVAVDGALQVYSTSPNVNIDVLPILPVPAISISERPEELTKARGFALVETLEDKGTGKKKGEKCFSIFGLGGSTNDKAQGVVQDENPTIGNPIADVPGHYQYPEYALSAVNYPNRARVTRKFLRSPMRGSFRKVSPRTRPMFPRRAPIPVEPNHAKPYNLEEPSEPTRSDVITNPRHVFKKVTPPAQDNGRFFWSSYYDYPDYYDYEYDYHYRPHGGYYW
ncbi:unnamed protein product [Allacma fusca]|uniref:Uncharacterized protein n=1 Tax=Allacma fusca TaxID=39272 RepID=A0A8J2PG85_9HEXA|nr:unnamed protein product [Allacma fusca]